MRDHIDQARCATATVRQLFNGIIGKNMHVDSTRNAQPVVNIIADFIDTQRLDTIGKADALQQLPQMRLRQFNVKLGLAKQHDLQQLALFGLNV